MFHEPKARANIVPRKERTRSFGLPPVGQDKQASLVGLPNQGKTDKQILRTMNRKQKKSKHQFTHPVNQIGPQPGDQMEVHLALRPPP